MANNAKEKKSSGGLGYAILAVVFALVMLLNFGLLNWTYNRAIQTFTLISNESRTLNSANGILQSVNEQFMQIVAQLGIPQQHLGTIAGMFPAVKNAMNEFESLEGHNELAERRFKHARAYVDAYEQKMIEYRTQLTNLLEAGDEDALNAFYAQLPDIYESEIAPIQAAASQMLTATTSIMASAANARTVSMTRMMNVVRLIMLGILVLGEIAILFAARFRKRANEEISRKTAQFADASTKLMRSREKMEDIAVISILTGLKNRYALEQDLGDRLAEEQFNIAVFDMDNFRSINDTYGYEFGDEYLAQVAERLKTEFDQFADIYNITGNEFCFVFKRTVSDTQAIRLVDSIAAVMSSPYTIFNLTVQLSVSASTYHYLAGDCLNVNSLLVKMDNVLRNAKRAGGGQILQVVNI